MSNISKRFNRSDNHLKNSKKFFSLLAMFLILTTTLSSVVSSQNTFLNKIQNNIENQNQSDKTDTKIIKDISIKQRILLLKEKITNIIAKANQIKNKISDIKKEETDIYEDYSSIDEKSIKSPILRVFEKIFRKKLINLTLMFYTNYSGVEKQTAIKFLKIKKIDINNDNKDDIKVKLGLSFSFERFLRFSINFKYLITRLPDFPDTSAHFEAYAELYFPGLLILKQKGDRIRFGYESPEGEEVPSNCQIIYRFIPNIIYLRKKPEHKIELNPAKNIGNSKIILLLGYTNFNNNNKTKISELNSRVIYNPAVKSSISIGGNGILGGSIFEFSREYSGDSQVEMYVSFQKNNVTAIGYVKDLPKKVTFTINFIKEVNIKIDTHGQVPSEIGICDDFYNPASKVYFINLPSKAELSWDLRLLMQQKIDISINTNSPGTTLKADLKYPKNSITNFTIFSKEKLDFQMLLDIKNGYFILKRNKVDIFFSLSSINNNSIIDFSTSITSFYDDPFEFFFDKLNEGNVEVLFSGSYIELSDLNFIFLKNISNDTRNLEKLKINYKNDQEPIEQDEQFLILELSSLLLSTGDFIKISKNNETQDVNLSAGGNGSVKLKNLFIKSNLLKTPPGSEIRLGLFEIESDHFYGSILNLTFNLSDAKNISFEAIALENAISKLIIENFSIKIKLKEAINLTEFRVNFFGSGAIHIITEDSNVNVTGIITGPGLFEVDILNFNISLLNFPIFALIEDFNINGPTTFFANANFEINQSKLENFRVVLGVNTQWHLGKFYLKALNIPILQIIDLNGIGQLSGGIENCQIGGLFDIILSVSGYWDWEKIYLVPILEDGNRPGIQSGSFSGNFTLKIHFPDFKKLGYGHFNANVYSTTKFDHFKIEGNNWSISIISLQMQPGNFNMSWNCLNTSNYHFLMDNSPTLNLEFDTFLIENKNTGYNLSFKSREILVPHIEIIADVNGDGDGFLFLDTDNQFCNLEITRSELIKINKMFRAEKFNMSWDFNGGLFNILDFQGFIEFGKEFEILLFINGKWRILISINEPVAEFTWTPTQPQINETIQFDASESYFSKPITRYDWKWYNTDIWHNNLGLYPTHSYAQNGTHKVTLRIWSGLKHSTCTKSIKVGESIMNVNIFYDNMTLIEGYTFDVLITDSENNNPLSGVIVTYAQQGYNGNWQNITNITNSDGIASFKAFDVPQNDFVNCSEAKIYVSKSGYADVESQWFQVYENTNYYYD